VSVGLVVIVAVSLLAVACAGVCFPEESEASAAAAVVVRVAVSAERDEQLLGAAVSVVLSERLGVRAALTVVESPLAALLNGTADVVVEAWPRRDDLPLNGSLFKTEPLGVVRMSKWYERRRKRRRRKRRRRGERSETHAHNTTQHNTTQDNTRQHKGKKTFFFFFHHFVC
jgi:hypothetical protein